MFEDLVPKQIGLGVLQRVLQNLLDEGVNIRDMRTIIETLAEHAPRSQDPLELTAQVRIALGRAIIQQFYPSGNEVLMVRDLAAGVEVDPLAAEYQVVEVDPWFEYDAVTFGFHARRDGSKAGHCYARLYPHLPGRDGRPLGGFT